MFVALDVAGGRRGERSAGRVYQASAVEARWLAKDLPGRYEEGVEAVFDADTQAVVGRRVTRFGGLLLSEGRGAKVDEALAAPVLAREAAAALDALERRRRR